MFEKLEKMLENPLFRAIAKGASIVTAVLFAVLTVTALIAVFFSLWWLLAAVPCAAVTGATIGFAFYLIDNY